LNHALKVIFLAGIPKISFTSEYFNKVNKVPRDLEPLLPLFKETVLKPATGRLFSDMARALSLHKEVSWLIESDANKEFMRSISNLSLSSVSPKIIEDKLR
jgi:hypothetical protein